MTTKEAPTLADIAVRCVADGKIDIVTNAIMKEWKQCETCSYVICKNCIDEYQNYATENGNIICPGSSFRRKVHNMNLINIKVEEILIVAKKRQIKPVTGILIQKAFYQPNVVQTTLSDALDDSMLFLLEQEIKKNITIKQEEWSNMGSVLVKRNRGKYVMWERLDEY
ncbi:MAG: hypothetical protein ACFFD1_04025 [Candidatus Thorarchaeota archaeon]